LRAGSEDPWERFAREDAEYFILTESGRRDTEARRALFLDSGQRVAHRILGEVRGLLPGHDLAIEIGCGVGRILLPMSRCFERVYGVDISPTMLARLQQNAREQGRANIHGYLPDQAWSEEQRADLIYSWIVFQHLEQIDTIRSYVERASRALKPGGIAFWQLDTRPVTTAERVRNARPDCALPRAWRRGIRRIRRSRADLMALFRNCGLELVAEDRPGTELHVFVLRRTTL
jgi:cyclopropane fatty-acyl-phospholipid synthase-like methyltransferase